MSPTLSVIASGGEDGLIRLWEPGSGTQVGIDMRGHKNWIRCLAPMKSESDRELLVSGGADGRLIIWDPRTQNLVRTINTSTSWIEVVAAHQDHPNLVAAAGAPDGQIGCWDASNGKLVARLQHGSQGAVRGLAFGTIADQQQVLISGGEDGTVTVWSLDSFTRLAHHTGEYPVWGLQLTDSSLLPQVLVDGEGEGRLQRRDPATGAPLATHLPSGKGRARGIATFNTVSGAPVAASGDGDGKIRFWDLKSGLLLQESKVHAGPIWTLGTILQEDLIRIASGGDDGAVVVTVFTGDGGARDTRAVTLIDRVVEHDLLGREILAAHLDGILAEASNSPTGNVVVHLDGDWGVGKSSLIEIALDPNKSGLANAPTRRLANPIIVRYDAWREGSVAPEWWSLATAIHHSVTHQRTWTTRLWMFAADLSRRLVSATPIAFTAVVMIAIVLGSYLGWWPSINELGTSLVLATSLTAALVAGSRVLFWTSPRFGGLHLGAQDQSPMGEMSRLVASLRQWAPIGAPWSALREALLTMVILLQLYWWLTVELLHVDASGRTRELLEQLPLGEPGPAGVIGAAVGMQTIYDYYHWRTAPHLGIPATDKKGLGRRMARDQIVAGVFCGGISYMLFATTSNIPTLRFAYRHPTASTVVVTLAVVISYGAWKWGHPAEKRRPILLVVDDLDRCSQERVVGLLEAIHTLLRTPPAASISGGHEPRSPLLVLVAADGRWLRSAFEEEYQNFRVTPSSLHGLGDDFMQKIFDHTVIVPPLSPIQTEEYARSLTVATSDLTSLDAGRRLSKAQIDIAAASPGELYSPGLDAEIESLPLQERVTAASARASRATVESSISAQTLHIVSAYAQFLPHNPRMIKRVVNTWGMLRAVKDQVGHDESDDTIVRAAILMVKFPVFARLVNSDPDLQYSEPLDKFVLRNQESIGTSVRLDVQELLGELRMGEIAACYGAIID